MRILHKLKHLLGRRTRLRRLEEEMQSHIALLADEGIRQGLTPGEARRRAHLAFGNVLATREEAVEALGWPELESVAHDARLTVRSLARRPGFTLGLGLILALGLGVTAAIFTLVRGMLWEPLPVPRPGELHLAVENDGQPFFLSAPTVRRLEMDTALPGRIAAFSYPMQAALRLGSTPSQPADVQFVSGGFFSALQLAPQRGRLLTPADDDADGARPVAVVSGDFWRQKLGGDPAAIGRAVQVNGQEITIVGVTPEAFAGVSAGQPADVWLPLGLLGPLRAAPSGMTVSDGDQLGPWVREERAMWLNAFARIAAGDTSAQGALEAAWRPQRDTILRLIGDPATQAEIQRRVPQWTPSPRGFSFDRAEFRRIGITLSLLAGAVVLATVANASTLLLLRLLARSREIGVRLALGAGRRRLVRALFMEAFALSLGGAGGGLLIATWLTPLLARWLIPTGGMPLPGIDATLLASLAGLALALGLGLGAAPACLCARLAPQSILQQRIVGPGGPLRLGRTLIVLQLAVSVLLVSVAAALALDIRRVLRADPGYAQQSVVTTSFDLTAAGFPREQHAAVLARLRHAAESLPFTRAVGFAAGGALSGSRSSSGLYFRGEVARQPERHVQHESVDQNYFGAMGLRLLRGRGFTPTDLSGRPRVAIITQELAQRVFGDADPLGRRFGFDATDDPAEDWEIIGVASDARVNDVRSGAPAMFYVPLAQWTAEAHCLVIRVEGDATAARERLQKTISAAEPAVMFGGWATLAERARQWLRRDRAAVQLTAGFGALAMLLAGIGVFAALGYLVRSRSRELAVRLAIGADPGRVWRGLVREALALGLAGAALGVAAAALLPYWLGSWLMTGLRTDWVALGLAAAAGIVAAVLGGLLPARHAARVDPLTLLRSE